MTSTILGHWWCWLWAAGKHHLVQTRENDRLFLQCSHCGFSTVGWDLTGRGQPKPVWMKSDYLEARAEMIDAELEVIGGG